MWVSEECLFLGQILIFVVDVIIRRAPTVYIFIFLAFFLDCSQFVVNTFALERNVRLSLVFNSPRKQRGLRELVLRLFTFVEDRGVWRIRRGDLVQRDGLKQIWSISIRHL